jgi:MobA/MobL family
MATTHFARTVHKGRAGGALKRVQYITRTDEPGAAEARVRYQTRAAGTETLREDLVYWRARNLPDWAHGDAVAFFSAADRYTSSAWTAYEEWKFALPRELPRRAQLDAARDFVRSAFGERHPYVWAMHDPRAADGGRQPHVHVLWSPRMLDGVARAPALFFRRSNRSHPERGGAPVFPERWIMGAVKAARVLYTDVMNLHLERAGCEARLHPDRLEARGILRSPEPRLSPLDSHRLKTQGAITPLMQEVFEHRRHYHQAKQREARLAGLYWEERKQVLGLTREMEMGRSLDQLRAARERTREHAPESRVPGMRPTARSLPPRARAEGAESEQQQRLPIPLVGNVSSKIVHAPGDRSYGDVSPRKQVLFWTVAEAEAAGYRAARNQHFGRGAAQRRAVWLQTAEPERPHGRGVRSRVFDEERDRRGERHAP